MNPSGLCDILVEGQLYHIDTTKPDFYMSYKENFTNRSNAPFCILSKTPVPMPNTKGEVGYLCVCTVAVRRWDHFPIYVVQKKKINYRANNGTHASRIEYIYAPLHNRYDKFQGRIVKRCA